MFSADAFANAIAKKSVLLEEQLARACNHTRTLSTALSAFSDIGDNLEDQIDGVLDMVDATFESQSWSIESEDSSDSEGPKAQELKGGDMLVRWPTISDLGPVFTGCSPQTVGKSSGQVMCTISDHVQKVGHSSPSTSATNEGHHFAAAASLASCGDAAPGSPSFAHLPSVDAFANAIAKKSALFNEQLAQAYEATRTASTDLPAFSDIGDDMEDQIDGFLDMVDATFESQSWNIPESEDSSDSEGPKAEELKGGDLLVRWPANSDLGPVCTGCSPQSVGKSSGQVMGTDSDRMQKVGHSPPGTPATNQHMFAAPRASCSDVAPSSQGRTPALRMYEAIKGWSITSPIGNHIRDKFKGSKKSKIYPGSSQVDM